MDKKGYKPVGNEPIDNSCPSPEDVLANFLRAKDRRVPKGFPADPWQAARFWIAHQIQPDRFTEAATPPPTKGGTWTTPYHDRLLYSLKRFLKLKAVHQVYVIENIEHGVPYRGDDIKLYIGYVEEHQRKEAAKAEGKFDDYVDTAFKKMKKALRGMTV